MKRKTLIIGMLLCAVAFGFTACSDDDDNDRVAPDKVPAAVQATFNAMFPGVTAKWEKERGMYKAEWKEAGYDKEAWFMPTGEWVMTKTDINPAALPAAVEEYISINYFGYTVDDADWIETPDGNYYLIELEKKGRPDVDLLIKADGTVISEGFEPWKEADGDLAWKDVPAAVQQTFQKMYPGITAKWERERGMYEAEWEVNGLDVEAIFNKDGSWVATKSETNPTALPQAVRNYLTANYPDYSIDDADWIETPYGSYYLIELEKKGSPDVYLKLKADGTPTI